MLSDKGAAPQTNSRAAAQRLTWLGHIVRHRSGDARSLMCSEASSHSHAGLPPLALQAPRNADCHRHWKPSWHAVRHASSPYSTWPSDCEQHQAIASAQPIRLRRRQATWRFVSRHAAAARRWQRSHLRHMSRRTNMHVAEEQRDEHGAGTRGSNPAASPRMRLACGQLCKLTSTRCVAVAAFAASKRACGTSRRRLRWTGWYADALSSAVVRAADRAASETPCTPAAAVSCSSRSSGIAAEGVARLRCATLPGGASARAPSRIITGAGTLPAQTAGAGVATDPCPELQRQRSGRPPPCVSQPARPCIGCGHRINADEIAAY